MSGIFFRLDPSTAFERIGITNANGEILWLNVPVGQHTVKEEVPTGFIVTTPNPQVVTVLAWQTAVVKFGNRPIIVPQKAKLEVIKQKDANENGMCEKGEPGMANVEFSVLVDGNVVTTGFTNVAGLVEFDLEAGTYTILEKVPEGYSVISANPQTITLAPDDDKALGFCNKPVSPPPPKANIKAIKFKDLNGNGSLDAGEPRLEGVKFTANGQMLKTTDANGEAFWYELDLGQWKIVEEVPEGYVATTPTEQITNLTAGGQTVILYFGNKPKDLPPTGAFGVVIPSSLGILSTLYALVGRQRRYQIELLRNL
jgi:hypothetical protein